MSSIPRLVGTLHLQPLPGSPLIVGSSIEVDGVAVGQSIVAGRRHSSIPPAITV